MGPALAVRQRDEMMRAEAWAGGERSMQSSFHAAVPYEHGGLRAASGKLGEVSQRLFLAWWEGVREGPPGPVGEGVGGSQQAGGPVRGPEAGFCLRRAESNKAWKGPGPRKQAFQMNSTHRNRKRDTI